MKIAYLHGLESNIDQKDPKIIFLNDNFDKAYMPSINYRDDSTFDKLYKDIKSLNPDLIVGSSMGGYVSYLIGRKLSIPVLAFNPALVGRTFDPVVDDSNLKNTRIDIRFGKNDSVISGKDVRKYLKDNKVSFNHTGYDGGHRVPADVFINSIKEVLDMSEIYNKIEKSQHKMKHIKLFEDFVNEAKVDKKYFDKVVKVLSKSKYPFTMMLVTKWNEVDIVIGQDAPDDIIDDISQRLHKAKLNWGGGSGISISGDSSNYSRREYDEITRINGGHRDY